MDYQRIIILLGLAVTSYFLILAWNDDYGQGRSPDVSQEVLSDTTYSSSQNVEILPQSIPQAIPQVADHEDLIPTIEPSDYRQVQKPDPGTSDRFILVTTDVLSLTLDKLGGDITSVSLRNFPINIETPEESFVLVDPRNAYSAQSGLIGPNGTDTPAGRPTFSSYSNEYNLGEEEQLSVELSFVQDGGVKIVKEYVFTRSSYLIDINYLVENGSEDDWSGAVFAQIKRDSQDPHNVDTNAMGMRPFVGGATRTEEASYHKLEFDDIEELTFSDKQTGGYIALVQHYFVSAFVPNREAEHSYEARKLPGQDVYIFGLTSPLWTVTSGAQDRQLIQYYVGPKDQYRLRDIATGLDLTIDYGFLWWMAQPLFYLLTNIQQYVASNWGLAIMLLTLCVKAIMYPLSAASYRSNAKLRKLQPEMLRLREQYGDDRQKLSQGMMELYKKEGTNPLSGCFPLLLQMPVFLALYWVLLESVELRQAPFVLWIDDLSVMDPYFVLPILMGVSMYFVTMLQPEPPDPMQAKIFKMMPIMFTFFFLWFPAGLVLYWLVNNVLSILQQWYVTRQINAGK